MSLVKTPISKRSVQSICDHSPVFVSKRHSQERVTTSSQFSSDFGGNFNSQFPDEDFYLKDIQTFDTRGGFDVSVGFSTAAGRQVMVSERSLSFIRNLLSDELDVGENCLLDVADQMFDHFEEDSYDSEKCILEQEARIRRKMTESTQIEFTSLNLSKSNTRTGVYFYGKCDDYHISLSRPIQCVDREELVVSIYPSRHNYVGLEEIRRAFLDISGVDPRRVDDSFVGRHFRHIVAKDRFRHGRSEESLAVDIVVQLHGRYMREVVEGKRSALSWLINGAYEKAVVCLVLCSVGDRNSEGRNAIVTDGWVSTEATLDGQLAEENLNGRFRVGFKFICCWFGNSEINYNCTKYCSGETKLGFQPDQRPFISQLWSLGLGVFGCVQVCVLRKYTDCVADRDYKHVLLLADSTYTNAKMIARLDVNGLDDLVTEGSTLRMLYGNVHAGQQWGKELRSGLGTQVIVISGGAPMERRPLVVEQIVKLNSPEEFDGVFIVLSFNETYVRVMDHSSIQLTLLYSPLVVGLLPDVLVQRRTFFFLNLWRENMNEIYITEFTNFSQTCPPYESFRVLANKMSSLSPFIVEMSGGGGEAVERPRRRRSHFGFVNKSTDNCVFNLSKAVDRRNSAITDMTRCTKPL